MENTEPGLMMHRHPQQAASKPHGNAGELLGCNHPGEKQGSLSFSRGINDITSRGSSKLTFHKETFTKLT